MFQLVLDSHLYLNKTNTSLSKIDLHMSCLHQIKLHRTSPLGNIKHNILGFPVFHLPKPINVNKHSANILISHHVPQEPNNLFPFLMKAFQYYTNLFKFATSKSTYLAKNTGNCTNCSQLLYFPKSRTPVSPSSSWGTPSLPAGRPA